MKLERLRERRARQENKWYRTRRIERRRISGDHRRWSAISKGLVPELVHEQASDGSGAIFLGRFYSWTTLPILEWRMPRTPYIESKEYQDYLLQQTAKSWFQKGLER